MPGVCPVNISQMSCLLLLHTLRDRKKSTKKVGILRALSWSYRNLGGVTAKPGGSKARLGYDAAVVSPIFFGYTSTTEADVDAACAKVATWCTPLLLGIPLPEHYV